MTGTLAPEPGRTVLPPEDLTGLRALASFVESHGQRAALLGPDGERVDLPEAVYTVLVNVVQAMEGGRAITVAPTSTRLTTQEAADLLGVSRPTLVKLLESGRIPYERPGRHRRVRLADLLAYRDAASRERVTALDELTRQAASAGGYDNTAGDYRDALERARHKRTQAAG